MTNLLICGEAWGAEEARSGNPFWGASGWELNRLCEESGLLPPGSVQRINRNRYSRDEIYHNAGIRLTNVLNVHPPSNKIESLCGAKWGSFNPIRPGKYLRPEFSVELDRLRKEIDEFQPNLILGLGATALWFATGATNITKQRGTVSLTRYGKFLPTFHPAYLFRDNWHQRPIVLFDFMKAKRHMDSKEFRRPERFIHLVESLDDIEWGLREFPSGDYLAVDIETREDIITCIGFAWSRHHALVIPFYDPRRPDNAYWPPEEEPHAWRLVQSILSLPIAKIFQNGMYDIHFLWRRYGITVRNPQHDTMLLHHALYPEMLKGLAFLGSIYTEEVAWKQMRARGKSTVKREDE